MNDKRVDQFDQIGLTRVNHSWGWSRGAGRMRDWVRGRQNSNNKQQQSFEGKHDGIRRI